MAARTLLPRQGQEYLRWCVFVLPAGPAVASPAFRRRLFRVGSLVAQRLDGVEAGGLARGVVAEKYADAHGERDGGEDHPDAGRRGVAQQARARRAHRQPGEDAQQPADQADDDGLDDKLRADAAVCCP